MSVRSCWSRCIIFNCKQSRSSLHARLLLKHVSVTAGLTEVICTLQAEFIEELSGFAPAIGIKPHIVILNHPVGAILACLRTD